MPKISAGLLMYRRTGDGIEVFLVHPGGPFWRDKDAAAWSVPKGEIDQDEDPLHAARREFQEETGTLPEGPFLELTPIRQRGGKTVRAWAFEGDCNPAQIRSNVFEMEWPPRSGKRGRFPEVDRARFLTPDEAKRLINPAQIPLIDDLLRQVDQP